MSFRRFLPLLIGFVIVMGLMIWLVSSLSWLYSQITWSANPLLANLILLLLIVLLGAFVAMYIYYFQY